MHLQYVTDHSDHTLVSLYCECVELCHYTQLGLGPFDEHRKGISDWLNNIIYPSAHSNYSNKEQYRLCRPGLCLDFNHYFYALTIEK